MCCLQPVPNLTLYGLCQTQQCPLHRIVPAAGPPAVTATDISPVLPCWGTALPALAILLAVALLWVLSVALLVLAVLLVLAITC